MRSEAENERMADNPHPLDQILFAAAFQALPHAACILEPMYGDGGCISDWRYIAANERIGE